MMKHIGHAGERTKEYGMPLFVSTHQAPALFAEEIAGHVDVTQTTEELAEMVEQVSNG